MHVEKIDIEILSAPSILGLKPTGVERLSERLLASGLADKISSDNPVVDVPVRNARYSNRRDKSTQCLNAKAIRDFSLTLFGAVHRTINRRRFPFVLGGDCSILIGIMPALKAKGDFGLIFLDAHADFYEPDKSVTGEVADMDLAIVTGRGPALLTNINNLRPYVKDENVVHLGQRDWEETKKYGSPDIRKTAIKCISLADVERKGMRLITEELLQHMSGLEVEGYWIHFDTDVLSDDINPAVDYRLPGGLQFQQTEDIISSLLATGKVAGLSVTIFNPELDLTGKIAKSIAESLGRAFDIASH